MFLARRFGMAENGFYWENWLTECEHLVTNAVMVVLIPNEGLAVRVWRIIVVVGKLHVSDEYLGMRCC